MNTIKQLLKSTLFFLLLLTGQGVIAADIDTSVDRNPVSIEDSFQIQQNHTVDSECTR